MTDDAKLHDYLISYLRGALTPEERFTFEEHLIHCEPCRQEALRLEPLVLAVEHHDTSVNQTQQGPTSEGQRPLPMRWLLRSGVFAIGIAAGLLVGFAIGRQTPLRPTPTATISMPSTGKGVNASLALYRKPWGTQINATFHNLPTHGQLHMVVSSQTGKVTTAWEGTPSPKVALTAAIPFSPSSIQWVGVYAPDGRLVDYWSK